MTIGPCLGEADSGATTARVIVARVGFLVAADAAGERWASARGATTGILGFLFSLREKKGKDARGVRVYRKKGKGLEDKGVWSKGGVGEKGWAGRAGGEGNTAPPEGKRRAAGGARFSGRVVSRPARRAPPGGGGAHRTAPVSTGAALTGWPSSWTGGKVVQPGGRPRAARPEATDGREGGHLSPQRLAPATRPAPPAPFRGWGSLGRRGWRHAAHPRTSADTSWSRAQCCQAQCAAWAGRGARRVGGGGHAHEQHASTPALSLSRRRGQTRPAAGAPTAPTPAHARRPRGWQLW